MIKGFDKLQPNRLWPEIGGLRKSIELCEAQTNAIRIYLGALSPLNFLLHARFVSYPFPVFLKQFLGRFS